MKKLIATALLGTALLSGAALAQTATSGEWRASKLVGVDVYNTQNEKIGEIEEVLMDRSGKASNVIIGVGGFLGMGEHDVAVSYDKLKWVNEPMRATTADKNAKTTTNTTTGSSKARPARAADEKWYPDHVVLDASKDQLKAMKEFKY